MSQVTRPYFRKAEQGEQTMAETPAPLATPGTITITNEQLQMLIEAAGKTSVAPALDADALAKAFAKAQRPENTTSPMVSVFNPKGEAANPKPTLRCKTTQNGIALDNDTLTWEEIEALNLLPPGSFRVAKANGQKITFDVKHTFALDGDTLERVEIQYPCKDEHRTDHRGLLEYCVDVLEQAGNTAGVERLAALRRELDGLRKKSA